MKTLSSIPFAVAFAVAAILLGVLAALAVAVLRRIRPRPPGAPGARRSDSDAGGTDPS